MIDLKGDHQQGNLWIWMWLERLLERLGDQGMSSDESDEEGVEEVWRVRRMGWRQAEVEGYMDTIDMQPSLDRELFRRHGSIGLRRIRGRHNPVTTRQAVARLPRSLYDGKWLGKQTKRYLEGTLKMSKEKFQLLDISAKHGSGE